MNYRSLQKRSIVANGKGIFLPVSEINSLLETVRMLKKEYIFYDIHVHPFEVAFCRFKYQPSPRQLGLYCIDGTNFVSPEPSELWLEEVYEEMQMVDPDLRQKIFLMMMRRTYAHTGSAVFAAHMIASCIDKVLLLPVATPGRTITGQMHEIAKMFGNHKRFSVGCSVPNTIKTANIGDFIKKMIGRFRIKAIKLHPNISEIDISSSDGKERVESLLVASSESDLPVIVHGGRNDVLRDPKTRNYSCIDNLKKINWGVGGYTVVIAHAGALCCTLNEMDQDILPKIKKLLAKHDNLMVDISGLDISALLLVLKEIDHGRILFGSDALYNSQWASVAKLMTALQMAKYKVEKEFIAIASANPAKYIFGR